MSTFDIGSLIGSKNYSDLVNSTDPFDLYNFTLNRTGSFQLSLSGLSANADVQLLNSSGATIASSTRNGTLSEGIFLDTLTAGSYTARIFQVEGNTNYNLNLTLGTGTHGTHIDPLTGMPFTSGVFTVGTNGQVTTDFIFDGGWFKGELAAFSLNGMESLTPGSTAFIREAARRAITNSQLGHILISNQDEGARISGSLPWEGNWNAGTIYRGVKTFSMPSGTLFGLMLIPNGRVQQVFDNPAVGGNLAPLFSLGTPATGDIFNFGQIADITGDGVAYAWEDFRVDQNPDNDYNDVIFQLTGASAFVALSDDLSNPQRNWKTFPVGQ